VATRVRRPSAAPAGAPVAAAPDVRLMNAVTAAIVVLAAVALLAAGVRALARAPWFAIRAIQLDGDLARNNVPTLRANVLPQLAGNFFSLDLARAKAAFETVPWVRSAVVRRVWPDRLRVRLEEHRPVALWQGEDDDDDATQQQMLVNSHGEVFEANLGDVEDDALPVFRGPPGQAPALWSMYRRLAPTLAARDLAPHRLALSARGSWAVETVNGQRLELGRGDEDELVARTERFARTVGALTERYGKPRVSADLRHADGYALRLQGVTTLAASSAAPGGAAGGTRTH
jgi:cell division protein FtsQ